METPDDPGGLDVPHRCWDRTWIEIYEENKSDFHSWHEMLVCRYDVAQTNNNVAQG